MRMRLLAVGAALAGAAALSSWAAAQPPIPESLVPCPFTAAEIKAALGVDIEPGQRADMSFPGGREVGCIYPIKNSSSVLAVRQTWDPGNSVPSPPGPPGPPERIIEAIPGDPDGARWEHGPDRWSDLALAYDRGGVRTRVFAYGGTFHNAALQPQLLKLKRVP